MKEKRTKKPSVTIYQTETEVVLIFSPTPEGKYRGASISFENSWSDGGACGLSGFDSKKELNKFLKQNNCVKKGTSRLVNYCWSTHTLQNGATLTCLLKPNHKRKHTAEYASIFSTDKDNGVYEW